MQYRDDIQNCSDRLRKKPFLGSEKLRDLPDNLQEGERVTALLFGTGGMLGGVLVLTDRRILWSAGTFPLQVLDEFPLDAVTGVTLQGILPPVLTLRGTGELAWDEDLVRDDSSGHGEKQISDVNRNDAENFLAEIKAALPHLK